jgi:hypothetical protein
MKFTYRGYVPIYEYGDPEQGGAGTAFGSSVYSNLQDLFGFEREAIDYFEVEGVVTIPDNQCGAV